MAVYQVTATGTKTTGTSTPGDWATNSNNYGSLQTALNQGWTANDQIILDDGTWSIVSNQTGVSGAANGSTLNLKSRSLDPALCIIDYSSATATGFSFNHASNAYTINIEGITFKKTTTQTSLTACTLFGFLQLTGNVTFTNCIIGPATLTDASTTARENSHFQINAHAGRTITFNRCTINKLTSTLVGGYSISKVNAGNTVRFIDSTIQNIAVNITGNYNHYGGLYFSAGALVIDNITVNTVAMDHADTATERLHGPLFVTTSAATMTVDGVTAASITQTGNAAGAFLLRSEGVFAVTNITATDCSSSPDDGINTVGGVFLSYASAATGTGTNIRAIRCASDYGPVVYASQGGNGEFSGIYAKGCTARYDGILYAGGWGDVTFDDFKVIDCRTGEKTTGSDGIGGAVYVHNHTTLSDRNKYTHVTNGEIIGCTNGQGGYPGILAKGQHATYRHDVVISNVLIDCPGYRYNIGLMELVGAELNLTASGVRMNGDVYESLNGDGAASCPVSSLDVTHRRGVCRGDGVVRV